MEFKLWLLVFIYSVIHSVQSQNVRHRDDYFTLSKTGLREIKIASVLPATAWRPFSIRRVSPAVDIAMEKVNPTLASKNLTLVVKFRDSKCDIADGINEAINFYVHNEVHVIFGPCCDYAVAPVARQVRYWDIPMITAGGMAGDFGIKKIPVFSTLTRVGPNFNTLVHLFIKVLAYYKWNKVQLIYHPEGQQEVVNRHCHIAANDIHYGFRGAAMHPDISLVHTYKKFETNEEILGNLGEYIGLEYAVINVFYQMPYLPGEAIGPMVGYIASRGGSVPVFQRWLSYGQDKWSCFNKARLDWNKVTRHKTIINDNPLMAKLIYPGFQDNTACINIWPGHIRPIPRQQSGINWSGKDDVIHLSPSLS